MIRHAWICLLAGTIAGCAAAVQNENLSPGEVQFEKDKSYCEAYTEFPVVTHPNYIKCMKDRGWDLPEPES